MPVAISFAGRVALVTGAGRGLGRRYALDLAGRAASVIVNDVDDIAAARVVEEIRDNGGNAFAAPGGVESYETARRAVLSAEERFGGLDIVVANAGMLRDRTLLKMEIGDFDAVLDVHLRGTAYTIHAAWPRLVRRPFARIVLTTSAAALWGNFGQTNYGAAKLGIVGFMNSLKIEGEKHGVAINTVAPLAPTPLAEAVFPVELFEALDIADVSALVMWLCSDRCSTSGEVFEVGARRIARARMQVANGVVMGKGDGPEQIDARMPEILAQPCDLRHPGTWDGVRYFISHLPVDPSKWSWPRSRGGG